jgi:dipeptidase E
VVGLREGAWLRCEGTSIRLGGTTGARLFRRGVEPLELASGAEMSGLVGAAR